MESVFMEVPGLTYDQEDPVRSFLKGRDIQGKECCKKG